MSMSRKALVGFAVFDIAGMAEIEMGGGRPRLRSEMEREYNLSCLMFAAELAGAEKLVEDSWMKCLPVLGSADYRVTEVEGICRIHFVEEHSHQSLRSCCSSSLRRTACWEVPSELMGTYLMIEVLAFGSHLCCADRMCSIGGLLECDRSNGLRLLIWHGGQAEYLK